DHPGTFNVAGAGVLLLSQAVRRAGRVALPLPEGTLSSVAALARNVGIGQIGLDQIDLFVHGRVVDTTRLVKEFGFPPRTTPAGPGPPRRRTGSGWPHDPGRVSRRAARAHRLRAARRPGGQAAERQPAG